MSEQASFRAVFLANRCDDLDATTTAVVKALGLRPSQVLVLTPIIRDACRDEFRAAGRAVERSGGERSDPSLERKLFLSERFAVGDGRYVTWGEATVADHEARIAMLEALRNGIAESIGRHERAIVEIAAAGVSCLDEIERVA